MPERDIGVVAIDWTSQGDEWVHHLARALGQFHGLAGNGSSDDSEVVLHSPLPALTSSLRARPHPEGIACAVFTDDAELDDDQIEPWRQAAASAAAMVGTRDEPFTWHAILGPDPYSSDRRRAPLRAPRGLGPVKLTPGRIRMRELMPAAYGHIDHAGLVRYSWPVIASATDRTYDRQVAESRANHVLHRVCALLTLFWGEPWIARTHPRVPAPGVQPLSVPQSVGPFEQLPGPLGSEPLPAHFNTFDGEPARLPEWAPGAWDILRTDGIVRVAVNAYYEAMRLEFAHPSIAYLGYVAAMEGFGARLVELTRCDCCERCTCETGATRRFRAALKTVMSNRQIKQMADLAYTIRSKTGHEGMLFGTETSFGYGDFSLFRHDERDTFDLLMVDEIAAACRAVLIAALREPPPATETR